MKPILVYEDGNEVEYERFDSLRWIRREYFIDSFGYRSHHWRWVDVDDLPATVIRQLTLQSVGEDWANAKSRPKRIRKLIRT